MHFSGATEMQHRQRALDRRNRRKERNNSAEQVSTWRWWRGDSRETEEREKDVSGEQADGEGGLFCYFDDEKEDDLRKKERRKAQAGQRKKYRCGGLKRERPTHYVRLNGYGIGSAVKIVGKMEGSGRRKGKRTALKT